VNQPDAPPASRGPGEPGHQQRPAGRRRGPVAPCRGPGAQSEYRFHQADDLGYLPLKSPELYDLIADPAESYDVVEQDPQVVGKFRRASND